MTEGEPQPLAPPRQAKPDRAKGAQGHAAGLDQGRGVVPPRRAATKTRLFQNSRPCLWRGSTACYGGGGIHLYRA